MRKITHLIDSKSVESTSGNVGPVFNPATGEQTGEVDLASVEEVDLAVESSKKAFDTHAYMHYLHHKYFNVNYGGDGLVPFDRVFGTYHDGSKESDIRFKPKT